MTRQRTGPALAAALLLAASPVLAGTEERIPRGHRQAFDGTPVVLEVPSEGRAVAAWSWWESGQTDLAVAIRDADGRFGEPFRFGMRDRADQADPALAVDGAGNVYLAFVTRETGALSLAILGAGTDAWTPAFDLLPEGSGASSPALAVVRDRLVVAWRVGREVRIADFPVVGAGSTRPLGVQDGPDGFNPLGEVPPAPGQGSHTPRGPGSPPPGR